jgi:N-carbamoyl-L-amino-acid hydrolase
MSESTTTPLHTFPVEYLRPLAAGLLEDLRRSSFDGVGVTREGFGPQETAAQDLIAKVAAAHGLQVARDRVRNLVVTLPGADPDAPFVATGSHLDSVPQGGNYDGAAGVVAGLLALVAMRLGGVVPPRTVKLLALRGEESAWFGKSWIGSHALFGRLTEADLALGRFDTGRSLRAYLEDIGADVAAIARGEPFLQSSDIAAFIETHIEQGPVLEAKALPLGVVTGIYGNLRHMNVLCEGQAAHAGATPRFLRHDAVVAVADLITRMDAHWARWLDEGKHLTLTHGIVATDPKEHAVSRVPGEVRFSVGIRADEADCLGAFHELLQAEAQDVSRARGTRFHFDPPIVNQPASMDPRWIEQLERLCNHARIPHIRLASGAGHDAAVFAHAGVPTAMLFIRNAKGSHNPLEDMSIDDLLLATRILADAISMEQP